MLRAVAAAHDHLPVVRADAQHVAVLHAPEAVGHRVDQLAEVAEPGLVALPCRLAPAGPAVEGEGIGGRFAAGVADQRAAVQVLEARHPELAIELARQPARHADMVGVHVRDDHALDRATVGRAVEQRTPGRDALFVAHARVDHGPTRAVLDRIQVDVVQLERQRHADPQHAGCHFERLAGGRRRIERVDQGAARGGYR